MSRLVDACFVVGFNFTHTAEVDRSFVALDEAAQRKIYERAAEVGLKSLVILSTCNRTELYGLGDGEAVQTVSDLYFEIAGIPPRFRANLIVRTGEHALKHIFLVASGLSSQIIGDLEVLGQFKTAFKTAKQMRLLDGFFERLLNTCIESAKEIRSKTRITSGTVSLSFAAAKILHDFQVKPQSKILVVGAGAFGANIARDVRHFLPDAKLFITNRTFNKAEKVAAAYIGCAIDFELYPSRLNEFDVIITAIGNAQAYLVTPSNLVPEKSRVLIDMSVPKAIDREVTNMKGIRLVSIDDASNVINESLETRQADMPLAFAIVDKYTEKFLTWSLIFEKREIIASWKTMLLEMVGKCPVLSQFEPETRSNMVKKSMAEFSIYLKNNPELSNDSQKVINHFLKNHAAILSFYNGVYPAHFEYYTDHV